MRTVCEICPHNCGLEEGHIGFCKARANINGSITCINYGKLTSIALDPIEKKPLARFLPGSKILSVGSFGCNLRCPFCQNHCISMAEKKELQTTDTSPEALVEMAIELLPKGNIGIAYTYNEPLVGYEYVYDCAKLANQNSLKNILVTNGFIHKKPLAMLLPLIDAMNIDLKGFREDFYKRVKGDLETVKRTIELAAKSCHVEITTLVIPGENDSDMEMDELSKWIASLSSDIPLHISRFFPRYKYSDKSPTPVARIYELADTARKNLKYVFTGNC